MIKIDICLILAICDMTEISLGDITLETVMSINKLPITIKGTGALILHLKK